MIIFFLAGAQKEFVSDSAWLDQDNGMYVRFDGVDLNFPIPGMSDVMPYPSSVFSRLDEDALEQYCRVFREKIAAAVQRFKPDVLHTHHLWLVSALAREVVPDLPMVTTCHGTCLRQHQLCPHISRRIKDTLHGIDRIVALSGHQKEQIQTGLGVAEEKIRVISGGYNKDLFVFRPRDFDGMVNMVYAGKLSASKGVPWLLESLKKNPLPAVSSSYGRQRQRC